MEKEPSAHPTAADYIYEALIELMKQKPYAQITIIDITKKAGVSRMAYYRNYRDKDDILVQHYQKILSQTRIRMVQEPPKEYWTGYVQRSNQDPIFEYIMEAGLIGKVFYMALDAVKDLYQTVFGLDMTDENNVLLAYQKLGALFGYLIYRRDRQGDINTDILVDHLIEFMAPGDPAPL